MRAALVPTLVVLASVMLASAILMQSPGDRPLASQEQPLPQIAPAPGFRLTSQDGAPISLAGLRGKVVAVTFIFTLCTSTCPDDGVGAGSARA